MMLKGLLCAALRVAGLPICFTASVMDYAGTSGPLRKIGGYRFEEELRQQPRFSIQGALNPKEFSICQNGRIRLATREEWERPERGAVRAPGHVEDRIRDLQRI